MRKSILFYASIAAFFATLFLVALSIGMIAKGSAGFGLATLVLGVPCSLGMAIVFDHVRIQMERQEEISDVIDIDPVKPRFTKYGGGG